MTLQKVIAVWVRVLLPIRSEIFCSVKHIDLMLNVLATDRKTLSIR